VSGKRGVVLEERAEGREPDHGHLKELQLLKRAVRVTVESLREARREIEIEGRRRVVVQKGEAPLREGTKNESGLQRSGQPAAAAVTRRDVDRAQAKRSESESLVLQPHFAAPAPSPAAFLAN
jgi:hypothetical protein